MFRKSTVTHAEYKFKQFDPAALASFSHVSPRGQRGHSFAQGDTMRKCKCGAEIKITGDLCENCWAKVQARPQRVRVARYIRIEKRLPQNAQLRFLAELFDAASGRTVTV